MKIVIARFQHCRGGRGFLIPLMPLVIASKIAYQRMFQLFDPGVPRTFVEDCRWLSKRSTGHWRYNAQISSQYGETSTSSVRKVFVHLLLCGAGHIHSGRVELLYWNCLKPGNIYVLKMAMNLLFWFMPAYVSMDSVSHGSWAHVEEKLPKYSSKWTLKFGNFPYSRPLA